MVSTTAKASFAPPKQYQTGGKQPGSPSIVAVRRDERSATADVSKENHDVDHAI